MRIIELLIGLSNESGNNSYFNDVIEDCRLLVSDFETIDFSHVRRTENRASHGLTDLTQFLEFQAPTFWMDEVYFGILPLVVYGDLN